MFEKLLEINKFDNIGITGLTNELISFCVSNIYKKTNKDTITLQVNPGTGAAGRIIGIPVSRM